MTELPRPPTTTLRTLLLSLAICLVCSLVLSVSTSILRPIRQAHEQREQKERALEILTRRPGLSKVMGDLSNASVEQWVIELATGERVEQLDAAQFDPQAAAADPEAGRDIPPERDKARIKRQARHGVVTVLRRAGAVEGVVLPVYGKGYASIISASVALAADGNTVQGLVIHGHQETPGIGSKIESPEWLAQWQGKRVRDDDGQVALRVIMDESARTPGGERYEVDGLSGATRSSVGVSNLLRFWLGDDGYGPFLSRVQRGALR